MAALRSMNSRIATVFHLIGELDVNPVRKWIPFFRPTSALRQFRNVLGEIINFWAALSVDSHCESAPSSMGKDIRNNPKWDKELSLNPCPE